MSDSENRNFDADDHDNSSGIENEDNGSLYEIEKVAQKLSQAKNISDSFAYGFEGVNRVKKKALKRKNPSLSTSSKTIVPPKQMKTTNKVQKDGDVCHNEPRKNNVTASTSTSVTVSSISNAHSSGTGNQNSTSNSTVTMNNDISDDGGAGHASRNSTNNNASLWTSRKFSKTKYLIDHFTAVAHHGNNKMDVICKLCSTDARPMSITIGNNSNMMNHIKVVSSLFVVVVVGTAVFCVLAMTTVMNLKYQH